MDHCFAPVHQDQSLACFSQQRRQQTEHHSWPLSGDVLADVTKDYTDALLHRTAGHFEVVETQRNLWIFQVEFRCSATQTTIRLPAKRQKTPSLLGARMLSGPIYDQYSTSIHVRTTYQSQASEINLPPHARDVI